MHNSWLLVAGGCVGGCVAGCVGERGGSVRAVISMKEWDGRRKSYASLIRHTSMLIFAMVYHS